nr:reverse transcriptase domain-containing protein [Tanacetum cinerariifolium]
MLKVAPRKGVIRFGKRGKLNPRYIGPFKILERIGPGEYKLDLPEELSNVHNTFDVSNLKKCVSNESLVIPMKELQLDDKLNFVEESVEIMDREIKQLRQSRIPIIKVVFCLGLCFALEALRFVSEDLAFCFRRSCVLSSEDLARIAFSLQRYCVLPRKHCDLPKSRILHFALEALRFLHYKDLAFCADIAYFIQYIQQAILEFHDTLIQHLESVKKSIDERVQLKREYDIWVNERLMQTTEEKIDTSKALDASSVDTECNRKKSKEQHTRSRSGNDVHDDDVDIRPIYDEKPMAEEREATSAKPHHMIASSNSRISSKNMIRFSLNDMVHNHYLEEAKKRTQERNRNSEPDLVPSARSNSTTNGSKSMPRRNTLTSRN